MSASSADKITDISKSNTEAIANLGTIGTRCQEMMTRNLAYVTASIKALSSIKTPEELFEVPQQQMKEGFELALTNSRTLFELTSSAYTNAVEPLQKRATEMRKSAA